jgi:DNA-binding LacI/PurR family transcriptional regulator
MLLHSYATAMPEAASRALVKEQGLSQKRRDQESSVAKSGSSGMRRGANAITAHDVAAALGVSQSTISRAFSTSASIAPDMRKRVMEAAKRLGYQPNVIARSLITRRTNIVAIVIANLTDPFYPVVLDALTQGVQARGFQTLLFITSEESSIDDTLASLLQYQVDAIVIASATLSSEMVRVCAQRATPVLLFNRYVPDLKVNAVSCDNVAGGRDVADFLAVRGHLRPAFVSGQSDATTNIDRRQGFMQRWAEIGHGACREIEGGSYSFQAGFAAAQAAMGQPERPDALFFASDIMAIGGLHAIRERGFSVPDDVTVIGFDDVPLASWPVFNLTTVRQPMAEMVQEGLGLLSLEMDGTRAPLSTRFIPGMLIERGSSKSR